MRFQRHHVQLVGGATVEVPDGAHQPHGTFALAREIHAVGAGAMAIRPAGYRLPRLSLPLLKT
jgi:hypothetical protein